MLKVEGTCVMREPYMGYTEAHLQIPGIQNYSEDILLLAIPTTNYSEEVPAIVGIRVIKMVVNLITLEKTEQLTSTCKPAQLSVVMSQIVIIIIRTQKTRKETNPLALVC